MQFIEEMGENKNVSSPQLNLPIYNTYYCCILGDKEKKEDVIHILMDRHILCTNIDLEHLTH